MSINNSTAITPTAGARRFVRAALIAGAIALGASGFGHTAIANAEWDIEKYDNCMYQPHNEDPQQSYHADCCVASGGVWNFTTLKCTAPADRTLQNIQNIPLGPRLGPIQQPAPPTNPVTAA